jgi:hypothetical protein
VRNIAQISRKEIEYHRQVLDGITAEAPRYAVVDEAGHKEWVVDVYLGPSTGATPSIVRDCPIAPIAHELVTDVRQPVKLERSHQGKLTVVGRGKRVPAGAQTPDGSILEPTYQEVEPNLADLGLVWIADLDYEIPNWGDEDWGDFVWGVSRITDAFGAEVLGPDTDPEDVPPAIAPTPARVERTRHVKIDVVPWGKFAWGEFLWGGSEQTVIELEE